MQSSKIAIRLDTLQITTININSQVPTRIIEPSGRAEDCKSSIESSILSRASISNRWLTVESINVQISRFVQVAVDILLDDTSHKIALSFDYKGKRKINLNCSLNELTEQDVRGIVSAKMNEVDRVITLAVLCEFILENDDCGGNKDTRKKVIAHFKDYLKREKIDLSSSTRILLHKDEYGRTLPERWQEEYKLPHKLRQVRSMFSKKNLVLFNREGWDTSHFGSFISFVAETTVSQPFTTSDSEIDNIINHFNSVSAKHPVFYDIYMLAMGCGLRQSEIYQVRYEDFTTFGGQCFLILPFATKRTKLKGLNTAEKVGIPEQVYNHFTGREKLGLIIEGGKRLHKRFIKYLKTEVGITEVKACHRLRKILGARLASTAGIYHAAKTLRNSVGVAERYYSDLVQHKNDLAV